MTEDVLDLHSQWAIAFATGLATISMFAVVGGYRGTDDVDCTIRAHSLSTSHEGSVISLRNTFGASAAGVEAWDITRTLESSLLSAFSLLVSTCGAGRKQER